MKLIRLAIVGLFFIWMLWLAAYAQIDDSSSPSDQAESERNEERERLFKKINGILAARKTSRVGAPLTQFELAGEEYVQEIERAIGIDSNGVYPEPISGYEEYARVVLTIEIGKSGALNNIVFNEASTSSLINMFALELVGSAQPFPEFPKHLSDSKADILVVSKVIHFNHHKRDMDNEKDN